ncbi:hypothetical protein [Pseudocitrobacter corydidari]|uniref:Uncharacterized protein n=1 Tax=Pseudocitrobacter corydidari TaxID=2891570 RepID=A0ABY3S743_9ENTR|nr:hypothetical protein [Pseudocitrobacter corydidari]UGS42300.1 hypothetical protein G163CM_30290 [Pseudocitrobacter corydidari]
MVTKNKIILLVCAIVFVAAIAWLNKQDTPENATLGLLKSNDVAEVIRKYDPEAWQKIYDGLLLIETKNKDPHEVARALQPIVTNFIQGRLPFAADENVIDVGRSNLERLSLIAKDSKDNCLRALYPIIDGPVNGETILKIIPYELRKRSEKAASDMVISSYGPDKHQVTEAESKQVVKDMLSIQKTLRARFGTDINYWVAPPENFSKSSIICDIEIAYWKEVLAAPVPRAAAIIRKINSSAE